MRISESRDGPNSGPDFWIRIQPKAFESLNMSIEIVEQLSQAGVLLPCHMPQHGFPRPCFYESGPILAFTYEVRHCAEQNLPRILNGSPTKSVMSAGPSGC